MNYPLIAGDLVDTEREKQSAKTKTRIEPVPKIDPLPVLSIVCYTVRAIFI